MRRALQYCRPPHLARSIARAVRPQRARRPSTKGVPESYLSPAPWQQTRTEARRLPFAAPRSDSRRRIRNFSMPLQMDVLSRRCSTLDRGAQPCSIAQPSETAWCWHRRSDRLNSPRRRALWLSECRFLCIVRLDGCGRRGQRSPDGRCNGARSWRHLLAPVAGVGA